MYRRVILTAVAVFSIVLLFLPVYAEEQENFGRVEYLKGNCFIKRENQEYSPLSMGQPVYSADSIKTLADSETQIDLDDGGVIFVSEDSEITIQQSMLAEKSYTSIGVLIGGIKLIFKKLGSGKREYDINAVSVTAGIRGTRLSFVSREDGTVLIDVEDGVVETEFNNKKQLLKKGQAMEYSISGRIKEIKPGINIARWRKEAAAIIRKNPALFLNRMLDRQRIIISRLKEIGEKLEEYKREWVTFLRRVRYLEKRGLYRQERVLVKQQIEKTRRGLFIVISARRQLAAIRSIILMSYRIENIIGPKEAAKMPSIAELRRNYQRAGATIRRLQQIEITLRKVLFVLNKKYATLNRKIND